MDGSFKPPKTKQNGIWKRERTKYIIYNLGEIIKIFQKITRPTKHPQSKTICHTSCP
jgi:hypothetical protein